MSDPTVVKILIMALGGQGGGVLTEWLFQACLLEGYPVRSTSIPGVAQRTGSTNYYLEIPTQTARDLGESRPEFCLYPTAGDVDLLIGRGQAGSDRSAAAAGGRGWRGR